MSHGVQMTEAELQALPLTVPALTAGRAHGMGRDRTHRAITDGTFPCPVQARGNALVVLKADLLRSLGYPVAPISAEAAAEAI
jgi:hypothetical protein